MRTSSSIDTELPRLTRVSIPPFMRHFLIFLAAYFACLTQADAQSYGLASRPSFTSYNNAILPTTSPTFSGTWSAVPAFANVTFLNSMGVTELPGQASNARRLVVWEREGRVYSFPKSSSATNGDKQLLLDISTKCQGWDDSGLMALAFHPNFGSGPTHNRYVFIYYTWVTPGTVTGSSTARPATFKPCHDRLSRFTVNLDGTIDPASETPFIDQVSQSIWHNGGGMFFHPDNGFLYLTNGDDAQSTVNTQRLDRGLYSGVLRIDVDQIGGTVSKPITRQPLPTGSVTANYFIPLDNPFVGQSNVLEEFFCLGLRSPHRMTCDPVSKRIFIGDVGLASWEEVDIIEPTESALNFQWDDIEGINGDLVAPYIGTNKRPVVHYSHSEGSAVIGGYVYRGTEFDADLGGRYIFGDNGSGIVYYLNEATTPATKVPLCTLPLGSGPSSGSNYIGLSSFGLDADNELYLCQMSSLGGKLYKLSRTGVAPAPLPQTLSATGVFSSLATLTPTSSFIAYDVGSPLWSDGAHKQRWFAIPDAQTIGYNATGDWAFPNGSVFVKHFELPINDSNPSVRKRLETRLLVRDGEGHVYGMTYKWRADDSDADLITSGVTEDVAITGNVDLGTLTSADIGAPAAGSTLPFNGGYAVTAGGADIFGTSDSFRFLSSQTTGNFDIATRIESVSNTNLYTKAGLMARESLAANSRNVMALVFPTTEPRNNNTGGYEFQSRDTTGGASTALYPAAPQPAVRYPNTWLRMKREGNTFTAYFSRDGISWTLYATKVLALPSTVYFGMAVTSHSTTALATARFNFNINRTQPWYFPGRQDCLACHTNNSGGVLGLSTPASNRNYAFAASGVTDNQLRAWNHVGLFDTALSEAAIPGLQKHVPLSDTASSAELRVRSYVDANCAHCHRPGGVHAFWDGRIETLLGSAGIVNGIVQDSLGISGAKVIVPQNVDKSIMYKRIATASEAHKMPPLAKNMVDQSVLPVLEQWIAEVVQPPADPLPSPWLHSDIGSVGFAGDATHANGTFIMSASGSDVWDNADAFHFAYQSLSGDGEIIARVQSESATDPYTKAGVMIRESLAAGAKNVFVPLMPAHGSQIQYRTTTNGASSFVAGPNVTAPYYVRLRRQGDVVTAFIANSAGAWQQIGKVTVALGSNAYIGLALTAHNNALTATALFDNVSVINTALPLELHVNFQPAAAPVPEGYIADSGALYGFRGNGLSYGWDADNSTNARDRNNAAAPDQRYDTFNHMQRLPGDSVRFWEVELPNGIYAVHVVTGDPTTTDSHHIVAAEGSNILDGIPSASSQYIEATSNVVVSDGRLTLTQGLGAVNTKINYVDITAVAGAVSIALTSPAHESSVLSAPTDVNFAATASTTNGGSSISLVEFYQGFTKVGEDNTAPFTYTWSGAPNGQYSVMAKATDSTGATGFSTFADITVSADGPLGLEGEYWPNITMTGAPLARTDANVQFDWANGSPMVGIPNDNFSVRWRGRIKAQFSETYTFTTETDDGVRLWVNGVPLVDKWINQGSTQYSGSIALVAGQLYEFEMHYFDNFGGASARLYWSSTSQAQQTVPLSAFLNTVPSTNHRPRTPDILIPIVDGELTDPTGIVMQTSAFEDQDAAQTHATSDWEIWSTDVVPVLVWSAVAQTGTARTYATLANGSFVNGFTALSNSTNYQLRTRHKDNSAATSTEWSPLAVRNFTTTPPDDPRGVAAEYYSGNTRLSGTPISRAETFINYTYGNAEPVAGVGVDNFSVRWRARVKPQFSETYTFTTETDDGARLWVNGVQLVDKWIGQGATRWGGTITLVAGQYYDLEMQYFDGAFGASAKLYWSSASQPEQIIPALKLYAISGSANHRPLVPIVATPAADESAMNVVTGNMTSGAFEDQDVGNTHAATDWEIWLDDATPTRIWSALNQTAAKRTAVALGDGIFEGSHDGRSSLIGETLYKMRIRHQDSSADANSEWGAWSEWRTFIGSAAEAPHGLAAEFYPNTQSFEGTPLERVDPNVDFNWVGGSPMVGIGNDGFVARWRGRVLAQYSQTYTFKTESDDGARLYVNGQLIIDHFEYQGTTQHTGTIALVAGQLYDIELYYLEGGFDANMRLFWSSPSRSEQIIPGGRLYLPAVGANHRPRSPDIVSPTGTVSALAMLQTGAFADVDAGQTHAATDWEIWSTEATPTRVWSALNKTGVLRLNAVLSDGVFAGALLGQNRLAWNTSYTVRIRHQDSSGSSLDAWSPYRVGTFTTLATPPWTGWSTSEFTVPEQGNATISGETADPDKDGLPNLLEYAFRTAPKTAQGQPYTLQRVGNDLQVDYPQNVDASDIIILVEYSTDLVSWQRVGVTYETLSTVGSVRHRRAHVPAAVGAKQFARIVVEMP